MLGLALAAVYLVPMLAELRYMKLGQWTAFNYELRPALRLLRPAAVAFLGLWLLRAGPDGRDVVSTGGGDAGAGVIGGGWLAALVPPHSPSGETQFSAAWVLFFLTTGMASG